jgi:hypothetical protein
MAGMRESLAALGGAGRAMDAAMGRAARGWRARWRRRWAAWPPGWPARPGLAGLMDAAADEIESAAARDRPAPRRPCCATRLALVHAVPYTMAREREIARDFGADLPEPARAEPVAELDDLPVLSDAAAQPPSERRAAVASWSARSFIASPEWPRTQRQSTSHAAWRRRAGAATARGSPPGRARCYASCCAHPALHPALHAVADILAVGVQHDLAGALQRLQCADRGGQLHAVVGGGGIGAGEFLLRRAVAQDRRPAARAGIRLAATICPDLDDRVHHAPIASGVSGAREEAQLAEVFPAGPCGSPARRPACGVQS